MINADETLKSVLSLCKETSNYIVKNDVIFNFNSSIPLSIYVSCYKVRFISQNTQLQYIFVKETNDDFYMSIIEDIVFNSNNSPTNLDILKEAYDLNYECFAPNDNIVKSLKNVANKLNIVDVIPSM